MTVVEIDVNGLIAAVAAFDLNDLDAAFEELEARYLAGEAAAHARTWSVITEVYAAAGRCEIPRTTADFVDVDHRQLAVIGSGELKPYLRASFADSHNVGVYIDTVHRLGESGAVVTHVARSTSQADFNAEWRLTCIYLVDGDLLSRCELFDPADLDVAVARFDELTDRPA